MIWKLEYSTFGKNFEIELATMLHLRRYNTMEVLAPEPTVMNAMSVEMKKTRNDLTMKTTTHVMSGDEDDTVRPVINIQR